MPGYPYNPQTGHFDPDTNRLEGSYIRPLTWIDRIIIHCTAGTYNSAPRETVASIRDMHMDPSLKDARCFADIGYHYLITYDGILHTARDIKYRGEHCSGMNTKGIGVCYCGGCGNTDKEELDTRTEAQKATMLKFVKDTLKEYKEKYNHELTVHAHYQYSAKGCPCFYVEQWLIDTGLVDEFPWLKDSDNMKMYYNHQEIISTVHANGKTYTGQGCHYKHSGVTPVSSARTDNAALTSNQSYQSPYKEQRDELAKRIDATRCYEVSQKIQGQYHSCSLFASPFYYLQNGYSDSIDVNTPKDTRKYVKSLLYLMSLPWDYSKVRSLEKSVGFFNNTEAKHGGIEMVPSGWVYLLGGIMWRSDYIAETKQDPIAYGYYTTDQDGKSIYNKIYKAPNDTRTPFITKTADGQYVFTIISHNDSSEYDYDKSDFINPYADTYVKNTLKESFMNFVDRFYPIIESLELSINSYGSVVDKTATDTTGKITYVEAESVILNRAPITIKNMTYQGCLGLINTLYNKDLYTALKVLTGKTLFNYQDSIYGTVRGFNGHYALGLYRKGGLELYYHPQYKLASDLFNMTYGAPLLAMMTAGNRLQASSIPTKISTANLKSYLDGFCNTLEYYSKNTTDVVATGATSDDLAPNDPEREFKSEIYMYLKNFWDRWLCGFVHSESKTQHAFFDVHEFFSNFIFIDTFYNKIGHKLRLNCNHLLAEYEGGDNNQNLSGRNIINHLGNVVSKHMCCLFNFANYIDLSGDKAQQNMEEVFRLFPDMTFENPSIQNKFVIIYTHTANFLETSDRNKFIPDTFDIWSYNDGVGVAPNTFQSNSTTTVVDSNGMSTENKMAYKVPAFGVAYSRQNNSYWKNIKVGMDTQIMTEQAARAYAQIAEKGNSSKKKMCFYGQDIYSIYQAYSYLVTIEMMGCAQIQPLMYFQLMNIPMFRGTYMIIKVEHSIKAGSMSTTFTGMKMSKVQPSFTTNWFTVPKTAEGPYVKEDQDTSTNGSVIRGDNGIEIDIEDNKLSDAINKYIGKEMLCDVFVRNVYAELGVTISRNLHKENDANMFTEMYNNGDWKMKLFKKRPRKSNNWQPLSNANNHPDVGDVLFGYHNGRLEGDLMHVAIYLGMHGGHHYVVEGGDSEEFKSKTGSNINTVCVRTIESSMMGESDDVYVWHAKCTKVAIEQATAKPKTKTETKTEDSKGSDSGQASETFVNGKMIEIKINSTIKLKAQGGGDEYITPNIDTTVLAASQAAFTNESNGKCTPVGYYVSDGTLHYGAELDRHMSGFIQYTDKTYKFLKYSEFVDALKADVDNFVDGAACKSILTAYQQICIIKNGVDCGEHLNGKDNDIYNGKYCLRCVAEKTDGLYFVIADGLWVVKDFIKEMVNRGYKTALYSDCAASWEYGWYRIQENVKDQLKTKVTDGIWYWKDGKVKTNFKHWSNYIYFS